MPVSSTDIGSCSVGATLHPVKMSLHKLILNKILVKSGLNGLKAASPPLVGKAMGSIPKRHLGQLKDM